MNSTSGLTDPKRVAERGYDRVAHEYARLEGESEWPRMRWHRNLLNRLEPGSSVLDLGCGSGDPADVEISKEHQVKPLLRLNWKGATTYPICGCLVRSGEDIMRCAAPEFRMV